MTVDEMLEKENRRYLLRNKKPVKNCLKCEYSSICAKLCKHGECYIAETRRIDKLDEKRKKSTKLCFTYQDETKNMREWANTFGVKYETLQRYMYRYGCTNETLAKYVEFLKRKNYENNRAKTKI